MKQPKDLTCDQIVALVESIQRHLYLDRDEVGRDCWNPEKSWRGDEFDYIARMLRLRDLVPIAPELVRSEKEPRRYVLYDFDADSIVGHQIYDDRASAADGANELTNVIVVPLVLPQPIFPEPAEEPDPCECQQLGSFCSGVPGILAKVENCRVVCGGKVERCDQCQRYPSDQAAHEKLVELGMVEVGS